MHTFFNFFIYPYFCPPSTNFRKIIFRIFFLQNIFLQIISTRFFFSLFFHNFTGNRFLFFTPPQQISEIIFRIFLPPRHFFTNYFHRNFFFTFFTQNFSSTIALLTDFRKLQKHLRCIITVTSYKILYKIQLGFRAKLFLI